MEENLPISENAATEEKLPKSEFCCTVLQRRAPPSPRLRMMPFWRPQTAGEKRLLCSLLPSLLLFLLLLSTMSAQKEFREFLGEGRKRQRWKLPTYYIRCHFIRGGILGLAHGTVLPVRTSKGASSALNYHFPLPIFFCLFLEGRGKRLANMGKGKEEDHVTSTASPKQKKKLEASLKF